MDNKVQKYATREWRKRLDRVLFFHLSDIVSES